MLPVAPSGTTALNTPLTAPRRKRRNIVARNRVALQRMRYGAYNVRDYMADSTSNVLGLTDSQFDREMRQSIRNERAEKGRTTKEGVEVLSALMKQSDVLAQTLSDAIAVIPELYDTTLNGMASNGVTTDASIENGIATKVDGTNTADDFAHNAVIKFVEQQRSMLQGDYTDFQSLSGRANQLLASGQLPSSIAKMLESSLEKSEIVKDACSAFFDLSTKGKNELLSDVAKVGQEVRDAGYKDHVNVSSMVRLQSAISPAATVDDCAKDLAKSVQSSRKDYNKIIKAYEKEVLGQLNKDLDRVNDLSISADVKREWIKVYQADLTQKFLSNHHTEIGNLRTSTLAIQDIDNKLNQLGANIPSSLTAKELTGRMSERVDKIIRGSSKDGISKDVLRAFDLSNGGTPGQIFANIQKNNASLISLLEENKKKIAKEQQTRLQIVEAKFETIDKSSLSLQEKEKEKKELINRTFLQQDLIPSYDKQVLDGALNQYLQNCAATGALPDAKATSVNKLHSSIGSPLREGETADSWLKRGSVLIKENQVTAGLKTGVKMNPLTKAWLQFKDGREIKKRVENAEKSRESAIKTLNREVSNYENALQRLENNLNRRMLNERRKLIKDGLLTPDEIDKQINTQKEAAITNYPALNGAVDRMSSAAAQLKAVQREIDLGSNISRVNVSKIDAIFTSRGKEALSSLLQDRKKQVGMMGKDSSRYQSPKEGLDSGQTLSDVEKELKEKLLANTINGTSGVGMDENAIIEPSAPDLFSSEPQQESSFGNGMPQAQSQSQGVASSSQDFQGTQDRPPTPPPTYPQATYNPGSDNYVPLQPSSYTGPSDYTVTRLGDSTQYKNLRSVITSSPFQIPGQDVQGFQNIPSSPQQLQSQRNNYGYSPQGDLNQYPSSSRYGSQPQSYRPNNGNIEYGSYSNPSNSMRQEVRPNPYSSGQTQQNLRQNQFGRRPVPYPQSQQSTRIDISPPKYQQGYDPSLGDAFIPGSGIYPGRTKKGTINFYSDGLGASQKQVEFGDRQEFAFRSSMFNKFEYITRINNYNNKIKAATAGYEDMPGIEEPDIAEVEKEILSGKMKIPPLSTVIPVGSVSTQITSRDETQSLIMSRVYRVVPISEAVLLYPNQNRFPNYTELESNRIKEALEKGEGFIRNASTGKLEFQGGQIGQEVEVVATMPSMLAHQGITMKSNASQIAQKAIEEVATSSRTVEISTSEMSTSTDDLEPERLRQEEAERLRQEEAERLRQEEEERLRQEEEERLRQEEAERLRQEEAERLRQEEEEKKKLTSQQAKQAMEAERQKQREMAKKMQEDHLFNVAMIQLNSVDRRHGDTERPNEKFHQNGFESIRDLAGIKFARANGKLMEGEGGKVSLALERENSKGEKKNVQYVFNSVNHALELMARAEKASNMKMDITPLSKDFQHHQSTSGKSNTSTRTTQQRQNPASPSSSNVPISDRSNHGRVNGRPPVAPVRNKLDRLASSIVADMARNRPRTSSAKQTTQATKKGHSSSRS